MSTEKVKRDATSGRVIQSGQQYRTHYRGQRWECYSLVEPSTEQVTQDYLSRHPGQANRVPPIETMP